MVPTGVARGVGGSQGEPPLAPPSRRSSKGLSWKARPARVRRLKLPMGVSLRSLRHTHVSELLDDGVAADSGQRAIGPLPRPDDPGSLRAHNHSGITSSPSARRSTWTNGCAQPCTRGWSRLRSSCPLLRGHLDGILAWTVRRLSSDAVCMNNKIKSISHRSFGFRSAEHFIAAIYHGCARLPLPAER